ncbi:MAG: hypothetical protein ACREMQ_15895 [Longimicrobiales bacterium]
MNKRIKVARTAHEPAFTPLKRLNIIAAAAESKFAAKAEAQF